MMQTLFGGTYNPLHATNTEYNAPVGRKNPTWNGGEAGRRQLAAADGMFHTFLVKLDAAPGNSATYTFTLRVNNADTACVVAITDPDTEGKYSGDAVNVNAGEAVTIKCVPTGTPSNTPMSGWSFGFEGDRWEDTLVLGGHNNPYHITTTEENNASAGEFWNASFTSFPPDTSDQLVARAGINRDLYVQLSADPNPGSVQLSLQGDTNINVNITSGNTTGSDTSTTIDTEAGDDLRITANPNANPTVGQVRWGHVYQPDDPYGAVVMSGARTGAPTSINQTRYNFLSDGSNSWTSTEANRVQVVGACSMANIYVAHNQAHPDLTYTYTVRKNGVDTALSVAIPNGSTAANNQSQAGRIYFDDFDEVTLKVETDSGTTPFITIAARWSVEVRTITPFPNSLMMMGAGI